MAKKRRAMESDPIQGSDLNNWRAKDHDELLAIWRELFPERDDVGRTPAPTFRSRTLSVAEAGLVFERWVLEAFRLGGAEVEESFSVPLARSQSPREQIDGLVFADWQGFLIESKLWAKPVDFEPIARLVLLVESRPVGTLGLFFSPSGYTKAALELTQSLHPIRVLLFDGRDLMWASKERDGMMKIVRRKWRNAVKFGRMDLPAVDENHDTGG
jgi:hypothetical protein